MTIIETLKAARADLTDPARWCRSGFSVIGIAGIETGEAVCAQGAIMRASGDWYGSVSLAALAALADEVCERMGWMPELNPDGETMDDWTVWLFNASCTHVELLAAFDHTIAGLEPAPDLHPLIVAVLRDPEPVFAEAEA